jgi:hypothetical protein
MLFDSPEERIRQAGGCTELPGAEPEAPTVEHVDPRVRGELCSLLSIDSWAERDIPEPDRLLGDLLTTTARVFLVGRTGLGKTLLGLAIAAGVASGEGFLHWRSGRAARVLYLDGEMPAELIKPRARDAIRRLGQARIPLGNLLIFGRDIDDDARRVHPGLPPFAPLNTDNGRLFLLTLIEAIGPLDLVIFDNVMSLIEGDQKDELAWSATLDLVATLTHRRIGQLWFDHTGHNGDRQYGSSTKAWRFDAVGIMAPLSDKTVDPNAIAFTLSFEFPGKARRRTPDNWADFAARTIRMEDDAWISDPVNKPPGKTSTVKPAAIKQYRALQDVLKIALTPGRTTKAAWFSECVRRGLYEQIPASASCRERDMKTKAFRARLSDLKIARWIGVDGEIVTDLKAGNRPCKPRTATPPRRPYRTELAPRRKTGCRTGSHRTRTGLAPSSPHRLSHHPHRVLIGTRAGARVPDTVRAAEQRRGPLAQPHRALLAWAVRNARITPLASALCSSRTCSNRNGCQQGMEYPPLPELSYQHGTPASDSSLLHVGTDWSARPLARSFGGPLSSEGKRWKFRQGTVTRLTWSRRHGMPIGLRHEGDVSAGSPRVSVYWS